MSRPFVVIVFAFGCAGLLSGAPAWAADADDHLRKVNARIYAMKSMKQAMSTIGTALSRGQVTDPIQLLYPAKTLNMAGRRVAALFPEGSLVGPSKARPDVWNDWAHFEGLAEKNKEIAGALLAAVEGGDMPALEKNFKALGNLCTDCHRPFREDD